MNFKFSNLLLQFSVFLCNINSYLLLLRFSFLCIYFPISQSLSFQRHRILFRKTIPHLRVNNNFKLKLSKECFDSSLATYQYTFEKSTAAILAGYAFDAYNEPGIGKVSHGIDSTDIIYTSTEFVRDVYDGLVMIFLRNGTFNVWESQLSEIILTGIQPDPFLRLTLKERLSNTTIDSVQTDVKYRQNNCSWNQNYFLHSKDIINIEMLIESYDFDMLKAPDLIGAAAIPLTNHSNLQLTVPLFKNNVEVGRVSLVVSYIPWVKDNLSEKQAAKLPKGATTGINWSDMISLYNQTSYFCNDIMNAYFQKSLSQICHIDNKDTDTQCKFWVDKNSKQIIISFRGTEQIKFQDILTDINLVQVAYDESLDSLRNVKVHGGFFSAIKAIRPSILQTIDSIFTCYMNGDDKDWTIYVTGHSLGSSLACLLVFELEAIRNLKLKRNYYDPSSRFIDTLSKAKIISYTFGAPRVGNLEFVKYYNLWNQCTYRIVNNNDIVPRLPRGYNATSFLEYHHIGRSVIITEDNVLIQDESSGACPLEEIHPFDLSEETIKTSIVDFVSSLNINQTILALSEQLQISLSSLFPKTSSYAKLENSNITSESLKDSVDFISSNEILSMAQQDIFFNREMSLLTSILDGSCLIHHLEPSYFEYMNKSLSKWI